jgi:hypothetical protein
MVTAGVLRVKQVRLDLLLHDVGSVDCYVDRHKVD